jgi:hypothetical protein
VREAVKNVNEGIIYRRSGSRLSRTDNKKKMFRGGSQNIQLVNPDTPILDKRVSKMRKRRMTVGGGKLMFLNSPGLKIKKKRNLKIEMSTESNKNNPSGSKGDGSS